MGTTVTTANSEGKTWDGANEPMGASYGKMMMWFFIVSDALTFTGFLAAYGFSRFKFIETWPLADEVFTHFPFMHGVEAPMYYVALMTFILIFSSVTMVLAVDAGHQMKQKKVAIYMLLTIIGGLIFVGSQAWEWYHFIEGTHVGALRWVWDPETSHYIQKTISGANMTVNEYGAPQFANFFFFITGFHGTHVFSGVVINFVIFMNALMGTYERRGHYEMIEKVGLYWHFVDLVWVFVFLCFYLL
jgi:cytochrome c oxidase subunit 3